jgi:hypothetical protein
MTYKQDNLFHDIANSPKIKIAYWRENKDKKNIV